MIDHHDQAIGRMTVEVADIAGAYDACRSDIGGLTDEVVLIRTRLVAAPATACSCKVRAEEIILESMDRLSRRNIFFIFRLPENPAVHIAQDPALRELLVLLVPDLDIAALSIQRLGRDRRAQSHPRPIRVVCSSMSLVDRLIARKRTLRDHNLFRNVFLSLDRTPSQISLYSSVKKELRHSRQRDAEGIGVRYVDGVPKFVAANMRSDRVDGVPVSVASLGSRDGGGSNSLN